VYPAKVSFLIEGEIKTFHNKKEVKLNNRGTRMTGNNKHVSILTFFSAAHGTLSKIDHIFGHKARLNKFKKIKITPCIISEITME
jgi:hypothetical protein